ncbi:unnamed protein product [Rotaria sordida]|uniref:Uncharacterized protein n=1 Tax=Rotaria sordida TaxID=392033 RepID=A0A815A3K3_9BILA|nr:unnamed protein product [Rotaria sordida]
MVDQTFHGKPLSFMPTVVQSSTRPTKIQSNFKGIKEILSSTTTKKRSAAPTTSNIGHNSSFVKSTWFKVLVGFIMGGVVASAITVPLLIIRRKL